MIARTSKLKLRTFMPSDWPTVSGNPALLVLVMRVFWRRDCPGALHVCYDVSVELRPTHRSLVRSNRLPTPSSAESTDSGPSDLVDIRGGTRRHSIGGALKDGIRGTLLVGLPVVGTLLGGPVGGIAGALLSGSLVYHEDPEKPRLQRLKKAATMAATSAVLGLIPAGGGVLLARVLGGSAGVAAAVGGGLAASSVGGLAGTGTYKALRSNPKISMKAVPFAKSYERKVRQELENRGITAEFSTKKRFALTFRARELQAQNAAAHTAVIASQHLGPALALSLARDLAREQVNQETLSSVDEALEKKLESVSSREVEGVPVKTVKGLVESDRSSAVAMPASVYMDSELPEDSPLTDFILGHELSHVKNRDTVGSVAEANLLEWVENAVEKTESEEQKSTLATTAGELEKQLFIHRQSIETRSDEDGYRFAREQGHSPEDILEQTTEFFGTQEVDDRFLNHPSPHKRVAALGELKDSES
jgi:hypothetical protein